MEYAEKLEKILLQLEDGLILRSEAVEEILAISAMTFGVRD